jgi:zinc transport system ATP-binding protein
MVIRCERLLVGYHEPILPPIDLELHAGRLVVVVGRNGSGKTTWFKTLLGLSRPLGGRVVRARPDLRVSYVPQVAALDPILPVRARDVVSWGRQRGWSFLRPWLSHEERETVQRSLVDAEAAAFANRPYSELSEGQKQRILFARMLAADAELVLLDEPTAAMDPVAERAAYKRLSVQARDRGLAVVVISHSLGIAAEVADELVWLDREGGHVVHGTPAEVLAHPALCDLYGEVHIAHGHGHGHHAA